MTELSAPLNDSNPDPRVACALVLDTSSSMEGVRIAALNKGFETFCRELAHDPLARKRAEVVVVTTSPLPEVAVPFTEGRDLEPETFVARGGTPLGGALDVAMDQLEQRKADYRAAGLEYLRPWMFILTDGAPTDADAYERAAARVSAADANKGVSVFAVAVGDDVDMGKLTQLSSRRQPLRLKGYSFAEMFTWLSRSLSSVSQSQPGSSDNDAAAIAAQEQVALPAVGWGTP